jgi:CheY-like chemotaxis protein
MDLLRQLERACDAYLSVAYPGPIPERIETLRAELRALPDEKALKGWLHLERENGRYLIRLGQEKYPHMKLAFQLDGGCATFFVDTHDRHFDVPAHLPGADRLKEMRLFNVELKDRIELALVQAGLPTFGHQTPSVCPEEGAGGQGIRVLIVDDELKILDLMALILGKLGACVRRATRVSEARALVGSFKPELIFCDIMMPEESGYALLAWLEGQQLKIPVYFVTGLALEQVDRKGVVDVIQKPFSVQNLARALERGRQLAT